MPVRTDDDAVHDDVTALLRAARFTEALVPAALRAGRLGALPRSIAFLAEIVRRGGARYAARLPEPLPTPEQSALVRPWLLAADPGPTGNAGLPDRALPDGALPDRALTDRALTDGDARIARWLDGVAAVLESRKLSGR